MIDEPNGLSPDDVGARSTSKPRLGHFMLLIAAVAIGIVGIRNRDAQMWASQIDRRNPGNWSILVSPLIMSLTIALMAAGLSAHRSCLSELCRQPGFAVCWVATLVMAIDAVNLIALNPDCLTHFDKFIQCFGFGYSLMSRGEIGFAVMIAWTTLAFAGC
jgi:hypothetical protein